MTGQELVDEVRRSLGNRNDITTERYILWLNWSMYDLCGFHRKKFFSPPRFHEFEKRYSFFTPVETGQAQGGSDSTIILASGASPQDGYYVDALVTPTSYVGTAPDGLLDQEGKIESYTGATRVATLVDPWTVNPDLNTIYSIYRRAWHIQNDIGVSPLESIWAVEKLSNMATGRQLTQVNWDAMLPMDAFQTGEPSTFCRWNGYIVLDKAPTERLSFRMLTYNFPTRIASTALTVSPDLPDYWHEVIALGAIWRGFDKLMEVDRASFARNRYIEAAVNKMTTYQVEAKRKIRGVSPSFDRW